MYNIQFFINDFQEIKVEWTCRKINSSGLINIESHPVIMPILVLWDLSAMINWTRARKF